jgi:hypothetical protein
MKSDESQIQQNMVKIFRYKYPKLTKRLWAVPNGGWRNEGTAVRLKREGVLPGVSDLVLSIPKGPFAGAFFEVKTKTGRLSEYQEAFLAEHEGEYYCKVVRSIDEFIKEVDYYMSLE